MLPVHRSSEPDPLPVDLDALLRGLPLLSTDNAVCLVFMRPRALNKPWFYSLVALTLDPKCLDLLYSPTTYDYSRPPTSSSPHPTPH